MPRDIENSSTEINRLSATLDAKRPLLMKIRGVTGTGIGLGSKEVAKEVVIQVFTDDPACADDIAKEVRSVLPGEETFETVVMPVLKAE